MFQNIIRQKPLLSFFAAAIVFFFIGEMWGKVEGLEQAPQPRLAATQAPQTANSFSEYSENLKKVRVVDDKGFEVIQQLLVQCGDGFAAVGNNDYTKLLRIKNNVHDLNAQLTDVVNERATLFKSLGL